MKIEMKLKNMKLKNMKLKKEFVIIFIYTILTIIFTYPVAFSEKIPGDGGDAFQHLWYLWWFKKSLLSLNNPYDTKYIFYPNGVNLAFNAMHPSNSILSIPLQLIFGLIWSYKILWLLSFIIAGYGTYLLVSYLTKNKNSAFISGLIFMFSPYHFAHGLGHLNITMIQWMPLYILYLYKMMKENIYRNSIMAAIFLFFNSTEYYFFIFMLTFTIIFLAYYYMSDKKSFNRSFIKKILVTMALFGIIYSPFIYPLVKEIITSQSNYMYAGGFETYSADILGFLTPSHLNPILGKYFEYFNNNFTGGWAEYTVFIGYTTIFLVMIAVTKIKSKDVRFWSISGLIYFIFSLGPMLHVNGKLYDSIKLPYSILEKIPIISIARVPSRWDVLLMLSVAVLAGYGIGKILDNLNLNNLSLKLFTIIMAGLILFEYLAIPYPMSDANIPNFYTQLKNDSENIAILEIPNGPIFDGRYMYYQTFHEKKILNGYVSRLPPEAVKFTESHQLIKQISDMSNNITNNISINNNDIRVFDDYQIRYIVLHENNINKDNLNTIDSFLTKISKDRFTDKEEDDQLIVYTIY